MNSELYTAASGLLVEERRMELLSNNLANLSTAGFRAQRSFASVFRGALEQAASVTRAANQAVALAGTYEVPGPGPQQKTGQALDVAMSPDELLAVDTPAGRRYTRSGSFRLSESGELVDISGNRVVRFDEKKPDELKTFKNLPATAEFTTDGKLVSGADVLGDLLVVRYDSQKFRPRGDNLYEAIDGDSSVERVNEPKLQPGWLEGSAVNPLTELVQLIETQRAFEGYQKVVSMTMNEVNRRAVSDIAG